MNFATYNSVKSKWIAAYNAANGAGSAEALPPGFLTALMQFLMSAFGGGCIPPAPKPADVKAAVAEPAHVEWFRFCAHREMVNTLGRQAARRVDPAKVVAAFKDATAACDDVTIQGAIDAAND